MDTTLLLKNIETAFMKDTISKLKDSTKRQLCKLFQEAEMWEVFSVGEDDETVHGRLTEFAEDMELQEALAVMLALETEQVMPFYHAF